MSYVLLQKLVLSQQLLQQRFLDNQQRRGALDSLGDPELDRYLEDERIALFLQNEEFMAELRWNKDFLSTLERGTHFTKLLWNLKQDNIPLKILFILFIFISFQQICNFVINNFYTVIFPCVYMSLHTFLMIPTLGTLRGPRGGDREKQVS